MHIISSEQHALKSDYQKLFGREINESLDLQVNGQRLQMQRHERVLIAEQGSAALLSSTAKPSISPDALRKFAADHAPQDAINVSSKGASAHPLEEFAPDEADLEKLRMLLAALARFSGDFESFAEYRAPTPTVSSSLPLIPEAKPLELSAASANNGDFQLSYDYHVSQWQTEQLHVQNTGRVTTADGRQIDFDLNLSMSRTEYSSETISLRAGAALKDPLVVNLQGAPVQLQAAKVSFDLDADGQLDNMARLAQGSAFLALDRNANGTIDDGRELFGAISGDGFADLATFDQDANGFIDSGDAVFDQLKLWVPDGKGQGQLLSLAEAGVGALSLKSVTGGFDLVANGELQGQVRSTGMFLFEDGRVGSLQQIDLVV